MSDSFSTPVNAQPKESKLFQSRFWQNQQIGGLVLYIPAKFSTNRNVYHVRFNLNSEDI